MNFIYVLLFIIIILIALLLYNFTEFPNKNLVIFGGKFILDPKLTKMHDFDSYIAKLSKISKYNETNRNDIIKDMNQIKINVEIDVHDMETLGERQMNRDYNIYDVILKTCFEEILYYLDVLKGDKDAVSKLIILNIRLGYLLETNNQLLHAQEFINFHEYILNFAKIQSKELEKISNDYSKSVKFLRRMVDNNINLKQKFIEIEGEKYKLMELLKSKDVEITNINQRKMDLENQIRENIGKINNVLNQLEQSNRHIFSNDFVESIDKRDVIKRVESTVKILTSALDNAATLFVKYSQNIDQINDQLLTQNKLVSDLKKQVDIRDNIVSELDKVYTNGNYGELNDYIKKMELNIKHASHDMRINNFANSLIQIDNKTREIFNKFQAEKTKFQSDIYKLESENNLLNDNLSNLENKKNNIQRELKKLKIDHDKEIERRTVVEKELNDNLKETTHRKDSAIAHKNRLKEQHDELKIKSTESEEKLKKLVKEHEDYVNINRRNKLLSQEEMSKLTEQLIKEQEEIIKIKQSFNLLEEHLKNIKPPLNQREIDQLNMALTKLKHDNDDLKDYNSKVQNNLRKLDLENKELLEKMENIPKLVQLVSQKDNELAKINKLYDLVTKEKQDLEKSLHKSAGDIKIYIQKLHDLTRDKDQEILRIQNDLKDRGQNISLLLRNKTDLTTLNQQLFNKTKELTDLYNLNQQNKKAADDLLIELDKYNVILIDKDKEILKLKDDIVQENLIEQQLQIQLNQKNLEVTALTREIARIIDILKQNKIDIDAITKNLINQQKINRDLQILLNKSKQDVNYFQSILNQTRKSLVGCQQKNDELSNQVHELINTPPEIIAVDESNPEDKYLDSLNEKDYDKVTIILANELLKNGSMTTDKTLIKDNEEKLTKQSENIVKIYFDKIAPDTKKRDVITRYKKIIRDKKMHLIPLHAFSDLDAYYKKSLIDIKS